MSPTAALAVAVAAALSPALALALSPAGAPAMDLLHAGAVAGPPLVALHASPEPALLEIVARGVGDDASISMRVIRTAHWGGAPPGSPPYLDDHGGGEATVTLGRTSPGETVLEVTASGAAGEARGTYVVRVLNALPPEKGQDRAPPSYIVGNVGAGDPARPRILAQASLPLCADTPHVGDELGPLVPRKILRSWEMHPTMSGVPPIEGMALQDAEILPPTGGGDPYSYEWWGCRTRASFGTQVPQWVYVCDVPGSDRVRYYAREAGQGSQPAAAWAINPHNGDLNEFADNKPIPRAAAPGPGWIRAGGDGSVDAWRDPHAPIPPDAGASYVDLFLSTPGSHHSVRVAVKGTFSFVPELLPFDGRMVIRATAFHLDDVEFRVRQEPGALLGAQGLPATVNGTLAPVEPGSEPHHHSAHGLYMHHRRGEYPVEPHYHSPPDILVRAKVSEIALHNGVLIDGITDGGSAGGMEVRKLHKATLVAEIPVVVPNADDYVRADPEIAITPWECWPRINHSEVCLTGEWPGEEEWQVCPSRPSGAAWAP